MKLTTGILATLMMTGGVWAQNPNIITNVQNKIDGVQQQKTADSNAALGIQGNSTAATTGKPSAASARATQVQYAKPVSAKPVSAKPVSTKPVSTKPAAVSVERTAKAEKTPASKAENKLERVSVTHHNDEIQIELATRDAVSATADKLSAPDRVVVELPATAMATSQSKIPVNIAGVKRVRIGVDGKTPPTTSVVIDLEHAITYELSPGPSNKSVLTLHVPGAAQATAKAATAGAVQVAAKAATAQAAAKAEKHEKAKSEEAAQAREKTAKPVVVAVAAAPAKNSQATSPANTKPVAVSGKQVPAQSSKTVAQAAVPKAAATKIEVAKAAPAPSAARAEKIVAVPAATAKNAEPAKKAAAPSTTTAAAAPAPADDKLPPIGSTADATKAQKPEQQKWAMNGKRDPFFSPIVQQTPGGSGCNTGKKCLEIGQINVRGIVKSEAGFIAVVTNSLNKAYFLHENDPVFNGFVMKITGDSVVFQESYQDKFGKPLTREVTKRVVAPAV